MDGDEDVPERRAVVELPLQGKTKDFEGLLGFIRLLQALSELVANSWTEQFFKGL